MIFMRFRKAVFLASAIGLIGGLNPITAPAFAKTSSRPDSQVVSSLLKDARANARELRHSTDKLASFNMSKLSWQSHAAQLTVVKNHVNSLGATLQDLESLKPAASPWQRQAIERMRPILSEVAKNTDFAIQHLRDNPNWLSHEDYRDTLSEKYELASQLSDVLADHLTYGQAKAQSERLGQQLELN